jgi:hypothetical protein
MIHWFLHDRTPVQLDERGRKAVRTREEREPLESASATELQRAARIFDATT